MVTEKEKIDGKVILKDFFEINAGIVLPTYVLLKIIKGLSYFESLSTEWWMVIALLLIMVKADFIEINRIDVLKKYPKYFVERFVNLKNLGDDKSEK